MVSLLKENMSLFLIFRTSKDAEMLASDFYL